jgi:hypothetical protein
MDNEAALREVLGVHARSAFRAAARERKAVENPVGDDYIDAPIQTAFRNFLGFQKWLMPAAPLCLPIDVAASDNSDNRLALTWAKSKNCVLRSISFAL